MGRTRGFDERQVVETAAALFTSQGYEATSIDDLVGATGLHRGSIYQAFGSKRGIFLAALQRLVVDQLPTGPDGSGEHPPPAWLDLLLVAALELAPHDADVRDLVRRGCVLLDPHPVDDTSGRAASLLGRRLLHRAGA